MSDLTISAPILFLIFNRPDVTQRVFEEIRKARPTRLYIASDGPRKDRVGEAEKVAQTRDLVTSEVDWDCEVRTLFREENQGCRVAVSSAIDWFFDNEEEGIILEDDCLPSQSFFRFCQELLAHFRNDERVMCVTGNNFQRGVPRGTYSYYFSQIPHCWGWASWRRAWEYYHRAIDRFDEIMAEPSFREYTRYPLANRMWQRAFADTYSEKVDTWDYLWTFANFSNHGLSVIPNVNLVRNIGLEHADATHTTRDTSYLDIMEEEIDFPLSHPSYMILNEEADLVTYQDNFLLRPLWWKLLFRSWKLPLLLLRKIQRGVGL